jgi:hypothetical protein
MIIVSTLIAWTACWYLVRLFLPITRGYGVMIIRNVVISAALLAGLTSSIYFLWRTIFNTPNAMYMYMCAESALFMVLGSITAYMGRRRVSIAAPAARPDSYQAPGILIYVFGATLALVTVGLVFYTLNHPHGLWDAWAIWNMKARFFVRGGSGWTEMFSPVMSGHPDYPLLIPATVARLWSGLGSETTLVPSLVAILFTLASILLLASVIAQVRGPSAGLFAGLVLMGTEYFIRHGGSQFADSPLAFYILAVFAVFVVHDHGPNYPRFMPALGGLLAGCAAWTKNEGLLFIAMFVAARLILSIGRKRSPHYIQELTVFVAGLAPMLAVLIFFKVTYAPDNDILGGQSWQILFDRVWNASRAGITLTAFATYFWKLGSGMMIVMLVYLLIAGIDRDSLRSMSTMTVITAIAGMLAGYFLVYLLTPHDLMWHLQTSLRRLYMQLWPSIILFIFLAARTPETGKIFQK